MSTLSVTTINTANGTTDLTISTGNTSGAKIVTYANGSGVMFFVNSTTNAAFVDSNGIFNVSRKLEVGAHIVGGFDFGNLAIIEIDASQNTYLQSVIQNANTGNNASSDLVLTNDQGNDTVGFVDLGINGSGYNQPAFNLGGPGDAYLYTSNGNMAIGTGGSANLIFHTGGTTTAAERMRISSGGNVGIGTTTPADKFAVTGNVTITGSANVSANVNITSNNFAFGGSSLAANGYTVLPNRLKMNWGYVTTNSLGSGNVSFSSAFTTNLYSVTVTPFASVNLALAIVRTANASNLVIVTTGGAATGSNVGISGVFYTAIGPI